MTTITFDMLREINRAENKLRILRAQLAANHETGEYQIIVGEAPIPQDDIDTEEIDPLEVDDDVNA